MAHGRPGYIAKAATLATLLLMALAACGTAATPTPVPATNTPVPTQTLIPTIAPVATEAAPLSPTAQAAADAERPPPLSLGQATAPLSMEFEGEGDDVLGPFVASTGVMILMANYDGEEEFTVSMTGADGNQIPSIVTSGPYFGNLMYSVYRDNANGMVPGSHSIEITANGPWKIRLFQEYPGSGKAPTIEFGGIGDGGGGWADLAQGSYTIRANHDGESHFRVSLHQSRGIPEVVVIDDDGPFDDTVEIVVAEDTPLPPGFYGIGVRADGVWSVFLEAAE